jgi:hypothetical protein
VVIEAEEQFLEEHVCVRRKVLFRPLAERRQQVGRSAPLRRIVGIPGGT